MPVIHSGGESPSGEPIVKLSNSSHHHHSHHHHPQSGTSEDGCERRMIGGGCAAGGAVAALCADDEHVLRGCAGCGSKISERFLLHALDKYWHVTCLKCSSCNATLADIGSTCFTRAGMVLCKDDYARLFAVKRCARCHLGISANELVMRAKELVYHLHCFNCASCNKALTKGEHFGMKDNMVYCRLHYEMLTQGDYVEMDGGLYRTQGSRPLPAYYNGVGTVQKGRPRKRKNAVDVSQATPTPTAEGHHGMVGTSTLETLPNGGDLCNLEGSGGGYDTTPSTPNPGGSHTPRTKRMRTSFKHHQLRTMKSYFALNQNPDAKDLKQLAQKTGLSKRVLQVWFQNARAKWRRNMMRQEGQTGEKTSGDPNSAVSELGGSGSHLGDAMSSTPTPLGDISGGTLTSDSQSPHSLTFGDLY